MGKRFVCIVLAMAASLAVGAQRQPAGTVGTADTLVAAESASAGPAVVKRPWQALGEVLITNGIINGFGRIVITSETYPNVTLGTIRDNLRSGFVWDDDNFYINNFGHPYQGSLYYNAARSNNLSLWQSMPYTIVGSLSWEYFCEREKPSINDLATTAFAGTFMGEVTHQVTRRLADERKTGGERLLREALIAVVNPVGEFHRIVNGRAWKVSRQAEPDVPQAGDGEFRCGLATGLRYLSSSGSSHGLVQPWLALSMEYGCAADGESHSRPYDFFTLDGVLAFGARQHMLSKLNMMGRLFSTPLPGKRTARGELGLYQFLQYEDTQLPGGVPARGPFPYGETVSLGPGLMLDIPRLAPRVAMQQRFFCRGVAMGAVESDYYKHFKRHYNMGSGYGASSLSRLSWNGVATLQLDAYYMHLYTWKGYEPSDLSEYDEAGGYLNVLGDRSHARLLALDMQLRVRLKRSCGLTLGAAWVSRNTRYKYHPDRHAESCELRAGLEYSF